LLGSKRIRENIKKLNLRVISNIKLPVTFIAKFEIRSVDKTRKFIDLRIACLKWKLKINLIK